MAVVVEVVVVLLPVEVVVVDDVLLVDVVFVVLLVVDSDVLSLEVVAELLVLEVCVLVVRVPLMAGVLDVRVLLVVLDVEEELVDVIRPKKPPATATDATTTIARTRRARYRFSNLIPLRTSLNNVWLYQLMGHRFHMCYRLGAAGRLGPLRD